MTKRVEKFREMNPNELEIQQRELAEQIFRLRFQLTTGQSEGLKKLREAKKDLARVKTLLREAQLRKAYWQTNQYPCNSPSASAGQGKSLWESSPGRRCRKLSLSK